MYTYMLPILCTRSGLINLLQELWLSALRVLPPADSVKASELSSRGGYLWKRGKSLGMWHRRFYMLRYSSVFFDLVQLCVLFLKNIKKF